MNFENILRDIANKTLIRKEQVTTLQNTPNKDKWMNKECYQEKQKFNLAKKSFLKNLNSLDRRQNFLLAKKKCKRMLYFTKKAFEESNLRKLSELNKRDPKLFWNGVKKLMNQSKTGKRDAIHPSKWLPYFKKLLSPKPSGEGPENIKNIKKLIQEKENHMEVGPLDDVFRKDEVIRAIKRSKNNKSSYGPIVNEMLKSNPEYISNVLIYLFSFILKTRQFPNTWNTSLIKPIHKSGVQTKCENYRGICISNHLSKLFTGILNERLESYVDFNKILPHKSLGFRKGFRTEDAMFILSTLLDKYAKSGKKVYACFIDFAKFYDTISHDHLFYKLLSIGVCGDFYFILKDMYKHCSSAIKVDLPEDASNPYSKKITIKSYRTKVFLSQIGLKQGCNLSPLLANIYLADLHKILDDNNQHGPILVDSTVTSLSWADDFLILSLDKKSLQNCIHSLQAYSEIWKLEVSLKKTKCVIFSQGNINYSTLHPLYYNGKAIKYVPFFKYFGVEFSQNCKFKKVKSERLTKARNAIFSLRRILCTNGNVSPKLALSLFDSKILPMLTYGSIIWNVDTACNTIIDGIPETPKTARMEIQYLYNHVFNKTFPDDVSIQRIGKKRNDQQTRPILIKFRYIKDKDAFLRYLHDNKDKCKGYYRRNLDDKYVKDTDIEILHYKYCKFSLNIPKESSTLVTLTE